MHNNVEMHNFIHDHVNLAFKKQSNLFCSLFCADFPYFPTFFQLKLSVSLRFTEKTQCKIKSPNGITIFALYCSYQYSSTHKFRFRIDKESDFHAKNRST